MPPISTGAPPNIAAESRCVKAGGGLSRKYALLWPHMPYCGARWSERQIFWLGLHGSTFVLGAMTSFDGAERRENFTSAEQEIVFKASIRP